MGTIIRPEISAKNKYWIPRHRYYELRHFCLQYPNWKKAYLNLDGLSRHPSEITIFSAGGNTGDPTSKCAELREEYGHRMETVEQAAMTTDGELYPYILKGITEGISYDALKARIDVPCCRDVYYDLYRRFFWLLDQTRK